MESWKTTALISAFAVGTTLWVASSEAEEEPVVLRYQHSGSCPNRAAFIRFVRARTDKARWVEHDDDVRRFEVVVNATGRGAVGTLVIHSADGVSAPRRVSGKSCEEVVAAMSLITALTIDPKAKILLPVEPTAAPSASASATPTPRPTPTSTPTTTPTATPASTPTVTATAAPTAGPAPPPSSAWRWSAGAHARATSGIGSLAFVMPVFVDFSRWGDEWLAPSFRLGVSYMPKRSVDQVAGTAEFFRIAAHPSACPLRAPWGHRSIGLRPCAGLEIGVLYGLGQLEPTADAGALWLAATVSGRLQYTPADWLVLELQGEFGVPLVRPRFYFEPDSTIVTVDPVLGTFGGGVGVRFP